MTLYSFLRMRDFRAGRLKGLKTGKTALFQRPVSWPTFISVTGRLHLVHLPLPPARRLSRLCLALNLSFLHE